MSLNLTEEQQLSIDMDEIIKAKDENIINEAVEQFLMDQIKKGADVDECIKAHYREGKIIDGVWVNDDDESDDEEVEVRTVCENCFGEGECFVSKARAEELMKQELMENKCPYGDDCEGEEEDDDEFEGIDFTKTNKIIAELKGCELALKELD